MHHKLFIQGVNMESQWIIWLLASINAVCVTNVFLRLVQDRADKPMVRSMLCLQTWTLLWPAVPHWLSLLTVILFQNKLALSRRAIFSPGRGCHPVQHIFFSLTSCFWLLQKCCHSRWSWYFWKSAASLPFPPPHSWLPFLLQVIWILFSKWVWSAAFF